MWLLVLQWLMMLIALTDCTVQEYLCAGLLVHLQAMNRVMRGWMKPELVLHHLLRAFACP